MHNDDLMEELRRALKEAHKERGKLAQVAEKTGLSYSMLMKVKNGETPSILTDNLQTLWCVLSDSGHLTNTFRFPVKRIMAELDRKKIA